MESRRHSRYVPLESRASWTKGLLLLAGAVDGVAMLSGYSLWQLVDTAQQTGVVTLEEFDAADNRHALVTTIQLAVYLVAGIVFIRWFHRAYANLPAIGVEKLSHGTGWAIGAWFVPLISLVWPKRMADEIWQGSDPNVDEPRTSSKVPSFHGAWWRTFIVAGILVGIGSNLWTSADSLPQLELAAMLELFGNFLGVVSGILAYIVVSRTSERQAARASKVSLAQQSTLF